MAEIQTEIELLKKEVSDMKSIHIRLDKAIEKIADVSSSLHTIMAVHEEKLMRLEEALDDQEKQFKDSVVLLHERISNNADKTTKHMNDMERRISEELQKIRNELSDRVVAQLSLDLLLQNCQFGLDIDHKFIYTLSHVY